MATKELLIVKEVADLLPAEEKGPFGPQLICCVRCPWDAGEHILDPTDLRYPSLPELEETGEAIRNTTPDNSRTSDRTSRSVQTGDDLSNAIKTLGGSLEKVQQEERLKAERMKKEKLERKMKNPQKTRRNIKQDELEL